MPGFNPADSELVVTEAIKFHSFMRAEGYDMDMEGAAAYATSDLDFDSDEARELAINGVTAMARKLTGVTDQEKII